MSAEAELEDLLQFLYQCPVGLIEIDEAGLVRRINPASARMLTPVLLPGEDLRELHPTLRRVAPDLLDLITQDSTTLGRLASGRRFFIASAGERHQYVEALAVRVELGRVMIVLIDVTEERRLARREHDLAIELQRSMLGRIDPDPGVSVSVAYRTAHVEQLVGGDWYDVITLPENRVGLVVGDAVGHSISAVAAMGQLRNAVRATAQWCDDPADLLQRMDIFAEGIEGAACSTLAYAVLDLGTGLLEYSSAGHLPPLILSAGQAPRFLTDGQGIPLACGVTPDHRVGQVRMAPGDVLLLYTDGLVERRTEAITDGLDRLQRSLRHLHDTVTVELSDRLTEHLLDGAHLEDDVCVLAVELPASAPDADSADGVLGVVRQVFWANDPLGPLIDVWGHGLHGEDWQNSAAAARMRGRVA